MAELAKRKPGKPPSPERRRAMIAAAISLMSDKGVDAMTTRDVAARAGASERTLFKHFGSKDGLVQAVIQTAVIDLLDQTVFPQIREPRAFTLEEFDAWHRAFLADRIANAVAAPANYEILFRELLRDARFRSAFTPLWKAGVFEAMVPQFERMQKAGNATKTLTPTALAGSFFSLTISYLVARFVLVSDQYWSSSDGDYVVKAFASILRT